MDSNSLKTNEISEKVIKFIKNSMKRWRVELTAGRKSFAEGEIQRVIFQGNVLIPLIFVHVMNHILRKCADGYKLYKTQEKINLQMMTPNCLPKKEKKILKI